MSKFNKALAVALTLVLMSVSHTAMAIKARMQGNTVLVEKGADGQFVVPVMINGAIMYLEVDTGAAEVILNTTDAQALGVLPIASTKSFVTGNGVINVNGVKANIQVGNVVYSNVNVYLNYGWKGRSVIGMSLLSQFSMVAFNKNEIAFKP